MQLVQSLVLRQLTIPTENEVFPLKVFSPMLLKANSAKTNPITNRNTGNSATLDIPTELIVISLVLALLYIQTF